ncbi:transporter (plasmid) [Persicobacter psychrovividus]|uniref:Transporter n=2 Tax=Persicobacter psychrovividus TaxID=387638 RepID=A0ABM7VJE2_9BACT|nr:transporter [Persicobacter psychrovividus]
MQRRPQGCRQQTIYLYYKSMFKQNIGLFVVALLLCFSNIAKADDQGVTDSLSFTLEQTISYAKQHSRELTVADLASQIARRKTQEYTAQGLPQINGQISQDYNYEIATFGVDEHGNPIQFGRKYSGNSTIRLSQMIFDGSFFVGLRASKSYQQLAVKQAEQSEITVKENVSKAYFLVLVNEESFQAIKRNYDRLEELLKETAKMYEKGFAEKMDVDRIKVQLNNAEVELNQNRQETEISRMMLKFQMGMNLDQPLRLITRLEDQTYENVLEEVVHSSVSNRIEYSILESQEHLKLLEQHQNSYKYLPTLSLIGTYGYNNFGDDFASLTTFNTSYFASGAIGLQLNVPIFDGMLKHRTHQRLKLEQTQLGLQKANLRDQIQIEMKQSQNTLVTSVRTVSIQKDNMDLAAEVYKHAVAKYQRGLGSNLEVIDADNAFKTAQNNYYRAIYSALVAKIELQKAMGSL